MRKAFTMTELIFAIVIIGILSAIAVPKFTGTAIEAYDTKAGSQLAAIRMALSTERQKRILKGNFTDIASLGAGNYAFSKFDGTGNDVVRHYISNCSNGAKGCWTKSGTSYTYTFADSGDAKFKLENNKLVCDDNAADCKRLEQ